MAEHNEHEANEALDLEFERLFSALDDVKASEELKASTLSTILALEAEENQPLDETLVHPAQRFTVIEGGKSLESETSDQTVVMTRPDAGDASDASQGNHTVAMPQPKADDATIAVQGSAARRKGRWRWRVAAILLAMAIGVGGSVAYALPATHVYATTGDATFDLGVNVFGITVTAEATNADGEDILRGVDVRNVRFEDAWERVLTAYEAHGGEATPTISVRSSVPFANEKRLSGKADAVVETHRKLNGQPRAEEEIGSMEWGDDDAQWDQGAPQPYANTRDEDADVGEPADQHTPTPEASQVEQSQVPDEPHEGGEQTEMPAELAGEPDGMPEAGQGEMLPQQTGGAPGPGDMPERE